MDSAKKLSKLIKKASVLREEEKNHKDQIMNYLKSECQEKSFMCEDYEFALKIEKQKPKLNLKKLRSILKKFCSEHTEAQSFDYDFFLKYVNAELKDSVKEVERLKIKEF
jgi:hypothetical protein